jgi:hypothetical protein
VFRETVSNRRERCEQLDAELKAVNDEIQSEEAAISALKNVISKSADILSSALMVRDMYLSTSS